MGEFFHDDVELALKHIFYDMRTGKADGKKGLELLISAANSGDADAAYFLARCYAGKSFVWYEHHFPEKDNEVTKLMQTSVARGSAVGVLGGIRTVGVMTPSVKKNMPFKSLKEAWDVVYAKAQGGEPFCQYMIGNTYFWGDIIDIEGKMPKNASDRIDTAYLKQNVESCIGWFEKAFDNGMYAAGENLFMLYREGKGAIFSAQPEKLPLITKQGAEIGYPNFQDRYADGLYKEKQFEDALLWYKKAYEGGQTDSMHDIGIIYHHGLGVGKDLTYALECYEKCIDSDQLSYSYSMAGKIYFDGSEKISPNYPKAVEYLEAARKGGNYWGNDMLACCYLRGLGCTQNYAYAKTLLDQKNGVSDLKNYCLGLIYADGLGVPEDINKGITYLQSSGKLPEAAQELNRFKKTLFGKLVRRK